MADALPWPENLVPSAESWIPRGGTRSGGQTFLGNEQIVAAPTARWTARLTIPCATRGTSLAMRRVLALGRAQTWLVGPVETTRAPWNVDFVGGRITAGRAARRPDIYRGDQAPGLDFALAEAAALNATALAIRRVRGGTLEPGMVFALGDRLHVIVALAGETGTPGLQGPAGTVMTAAIRPWLRADHQAGTPLTFDRPRGRMRLAADDTGAMEQQLSRISTVALDLVEPF